MHLLDAALILFPQQQIFSCMLPLSLMLPSLLAAAALTMGFIWLRAFWMPVLDDEHTFIGIGN